MEQLQIQEIQPQQTEILYAVEKLGESSRMIKQALAELPVLRKRLEKHKTGPRAKEIFGDLSTLRTRLCDALTTAALNLFELDMDELAQEITKLSGSVKAFNLLTPDYTKLVSVLDSYQAKLPVGDEKRTTNASIIARLMNNVRMGYYPTDLGNMEYIKRGIEPPKGQVTLNIFDPCCGCSLALHSISEYLKNSGSNVMSYGIEIDNHRAEESLSRINRVGFGSYFYSRVSRDAFHLMLLNPPYLSVINPNGGNTRSEKRFLVDSLSHLVIGGLLIYIIPHHRMTLDICRVLVDNFEDITIWKFTGDEFGRFKQVAILGTRMKRIDGSDKVQNIMSLALAPNSIPELTDLPPARYVLPNKPATVTLFKGSKFNVAELQDQLKRSTSFSKLFQRNKIDSLENRRPLLPLSLSQIGLVGGSGLINGLVECDTPHIIKGRIVKSNKQTSEENYNSRGDMYSTTITEVRSNKMIFNILTPDGFFSLTDLTSGPESSDDKDGIDLGDEPDDALPLPMLNNRKIGRALFPLGRTVITANAQSVLSPEDINIALSRHQAGDWGLTDPEDIRTNEQALKLGERIMSVYNDANDTSFWIITERDRSVTTVLLPSDY